MTVLLIIVGVLLFLMVFVVAFGAPYVPSRPADIRRAFDDLYDIGPNDLLVDIGSGDGLVLREAARRGARAVGYELNPLLVLISVFTSRRFRGIDTKLANFWKQDFPLSTTIVYVFGESRDIERMARKVQREATRLNRELYLLSYGFEVPGSQYMRKNRSHFLYGFSPLQEQ